MAVSEKSKAVLCVCVCVCMHVHTHATVYTPEAPTRESVKTKSEVEQDTVGLLGTKVCPCLLFLFCRK